MSKRCRVIKEPISRLLSANSDLINALYFTLVFEERLLYLFIIVCRKLTKLFVRASPCGSAPHQCPEISKILSSIKALALRSYGSILSILFGTEDAPTIGLITTVSSIPENLVDTATVYHLTVSKAFASLSCHG